MTLQLAPLLRGRYPVIGYHGYVRMVIEK